MPRKARSAGWTALLALLFLTASVLASAYFLLPLLFERMAASDIRDRLDLESAPEVELERGSPARVLSGRFSEGQVTMEDVGLGGLRVDRAVVDLDPFDVDLIESVAGGTIETGKPLSGALRAAISEEGVTRLARAEAGVFVRDVELRRGRMLVRSTVAVFGLDGPLSVKARPVLQDESLIFEPQRVEPFGSSLPEGFSEQALAGTDFAYPLDELPYGAKISGVQVQEGRLILSGGVERIPLGSPGG